MARPAAKFDKSNKQTKHKQRKDKPKPADTKDSKIDTGSSAQIADQDFLKLDDVLALGGDKGDYDLLKDADSEIEDAEEFAVDAKLARELKAFFKTNNIKPPADEEDASADEQESENESSSHSEEEQVSNVAATSNFSNNLVVMPHPQWYNIELPKLPESSAEVDAATLIALHERGTHLLTAVASTFAASLANPKSKNAENSTLSAADRAFISTILKSGTSSDKLSALVLLTSSSPLHTTTYLSQLQAICKKKSREEAMRAIRAVVDWVRGGADAAESGAAGGLPDRKLKYFNDQAGLAQVVKARESVKKAKLQTESTETLPGDQHLIVWAFEDWLKKWYFDLLKIIEALSHDPLPFVRNQMITHLYSLLSGKPEQEQNLLRVLVDKLSDGDRAVSSKASHVLLQLLEQHPMMKSMVNSEVAAVVLRPVSPHATPAQARSHENARYYGIITLNQIVLSRVHDKEVAAKLIETYFEVFNDILRTIQASAIPKPSKNKTNGKRKRNQPAKDSKAEGPTQAEQDREAKLLAAVLTGVNRAIPYAEMSDDVLQKRLDVLFKIIHTGTFNVSIQALQLIFQVSSSQQMISDRFYRTLYEILLDDRLPSSSKHAMFLNLIYKAVKMDTSRNRVAAFLKRLIQSLSSHQPPFVCGVLFLLKEICTLMPSLRSMITECEDAEPAIEANGYHSSGDEDTETKIPSTNVKAAGTYDGRKRDPQFANAQNSCLWEIMPFLHHFHPSVVEQAEALVSGQRTKAVKPDLEQHTLSQFLDRFAYRDSKKGVQATKGASAMQPSKAGKKDNLLSLRKGASQEDGPVNDTAFWHKSADKVPADQLFFHRYFNLHSDTSASKAKAKSSHGKDDASDYSEVDIEDLGGDGETDDDLEDEIWKAMKKSMPEAGGSDSEADIGELSDADEDDIDPAEFDYSDSEDENEAEEELAPKSKKAKQSAFEPESDEDSGMEAFLEDEDDLVDSDAEMPDISMLVDGDEAEQSEEESKSKKKKSKKLKSLPLLASAEDWAALIDADDD